MLEAGWSWPQCLDTESLVSVAAWEHLPTKHLRRAWPMAHLAAMFGNVNGGKADSGKKVDRRKLFEPLELLPWYARPEGFEPPLPMLSPHHCAALVHALESGWLKNSSWVIQAIDIEDSLDRVREVGANFLEIQNEELE